MPTRRCLWSCLSAGSLLFLVSCGGGGSSSPPPNQPPVAVFTVAPEGGPAPLDVSFDASGSRDSDGTIVGYEWDFGGGATASGRSVRHTFEQKGEYTVRLTVTDDDDATAVASESLLVNANPVASIAADPVGGVAPLTVSFDGTGSSDPDGEIQRYAWNFGTESAEGEVTTRTFAEPGLYAARLTVTDDLGGRGEVVFELNVRDPARSDIDHAAPYVANGAYANALDRCLYTYAEDSTRCSMEELPFLGAEFDQPTIDDVMSRVLVSHRWMGDNLRTLLELLPADARLLARSLTGIVVATDIRPAHYRPYTGAIYMDADFFWRTAEQFAVVSREPDYRAAFRRKLQVRLPWRFVRNNERFAIRRDENGVRAVEDTAVYLGFLLFHELSHAGDFMHASRIAALDPAATPLEAMLGEDNGAWEQWPSSRLRTVHPLMSQRMLDLARVSFTDTPATEEQAALRPEDIVDDFANDGAVDYYSYLTQYEDLADLHTAALMSYHFGQEQDTGITDNPTQSGAPFTVAWGQRGRITDPLVIDRTRFVLETMYPGDVNTMVGYVSNRPAPLPMRVGDSWTSNVTLAGGEDFSSRTPPPAMTSVPSARHIGISNLDSGMSAVLAGGETHPREAPTYLGCIRLDGVPVQMRERLGLHMQPLAQDAVRSAGATSPR